MREMKWHIYNTEMSNKPLCWGHAALEFDTEEDAIYFLNSIPNKGEHLNSYVQKDILFYDNGYINATGKIVNLNSEGIEILVERVK